MSRFWNRRRNKSPPPPPGWTPAPERSYVYGRYNEAPQSDYERAEDFCTQNPLEFPRLLSSNDIDRIVHEKSRAWGLESFASADSNSPRFAGHIYTNWPCKHGDGRMGYVTRVQTTSACADSCLISNLPLLAGQYYMPQNGGVYYEITVQEMRAPDGVIAIGTACRPYPSFRLPGWHRLSAALHLDDMRKFYEDPNGGFEYPELDNVRILSGDTIGCGYEFKTGSLFFTYNGGRRHHAFYPSYRDRDVYAVVGVAGVTDFTVNFGGDEFRWKEGNEPGWRLDHHVGRLSAPSVTPQEDLPPYSLQQ